MINKLAALRGFALLVAGLLWLSACSSVPPSEENKPPSNTDKVAVIKDRISKVQSELASQRAAVKALINNDTDLELLLRLLNSPEPEAATAEGQSPSENTQPTMKRIDRLQTMIANQALLKSELKKLFDQLQDLQQHNESVSR